MVEFWNESQIKKLHKANWLVVIIGKASSNSEKNYIEGLFKYLGTIISGTPKIEIQLIPDLAQITNRVYHEDAYLEDIIYQDIVKKIEEYIFDINVPQLQIAVLIDYDVIKHYNIYEIIVKTISKRHMWHSFCSYPNFEYWLHSHLYDYSDDKYLMERNIENEIKKIIVGYSINNPDIFQVFMEKCNLTEMLTKTNRNCQYTCHSCIELNKCIHSCIHKMIKAMIPEINKLLYP